ncbi:MAG: SCO family protein [Sphingomonadaceae bacterium]|nr:SCO family protein [Sphingomonadaceae bacterium]
MNRRAMCAFSRIISSLLLSLALVACGAEPQPGADRPPLEGAAVGGPFTLIDKTGEDVRWADFSGSYRIVYFGYTFCPDACPVDMQVLMSGLKKFEAAQPSLAAKVQPIFISIDPERDGPEQVGQFADAFHSRLIGLTGSSEQIDQAVKAFAAYYAKGTETAGGYLMDHSRVAYLMDPDGKPLATLPADKSPDAVSAELTKWVH